MRRFIVLLLITGTVWAQNGLDKLVPVLDYEHLSIKDKAIYDAKKDARRWLLYPSFAILLTGVSIHSYFYFFWDEGPEGDTSLNNILSVATATSALVGSHHLFSKSDKSNIEGIISKDIELYKEMYYKQFKKQKLKNIMISIGVKGIVGGLGTYMVVSSI